MVFVVPVVPLWFTWSVAQLELTPLVPASPRPHPLRPLAYGSRLKIVVAFRFSISIMEPALHCARSLTA